MQRLSRSLTLWLQGGLGNQLFQLNACEHMARLSDVPLLVSSNSYRRDRLRSFDASSVTDPGMHTSTAEDWLIGKPHSFTGSLKSRSGVLGLKVVTALGKVEPGSLAVGYFQEEDCLSLDSSPVVARLIQHRDTLRLRSLVDRVDGRTVAHIRRGDYVSNPAAAARFGAIAPRFYLDAFDSLNTSVDDVVFFTNDEEYVVETFGVQESQVVTHIDGYSDLDLMVLMSVGSNLVIPNSTFSWWAAEMMGDQGRVVVPDEWFRDEPGRTLARSIWLRLPN